MAENDDGRSAELKARLAALEVEFRDSLPGRIGEIEAALTALEEHWSEAALDALMGAAHRLGGAAGTFGLMSVSAVSADIEAQARELLEGDAVRDNAVRANLRALLARLVEVST